MCQHQGATRVTADVSSWSADADVIVVKVDVSVDWSTLTQSTVGSTCQRSAGPTGQPQCVTDKWGPHVSRV